MNTSTLASGPAERRVSAGGGGDLLVTPRQLPRATPRHLVMRHLHVSE